MLRTLPSPPSPRERAAQCWALTTPGGAQLLVLQGQDLLVQLLSLLELSLLHETRGLAGERKQTTGGEVGG